MMLQTLLIFSARWTAIFFFIIIMFQKILAGGGTQELYALEKIASRFISNYSCGN
jgi:hypothetical protein